MVSLICAESELAFKKGSNTFEMGFTAAWNEGVGGTIAWERGTINDMFSLGGEHSFHTKNESYEYYSPYSSLLSEEYRELLQYTTKSLYISSLFGIGFHPFGIPTLKGKIPVAEKLDPYIIARAGVLYTFGTHDVLSGYVPAFSAMWEFA